MKKILWLLMGLTFAAEQAYAAPRPVAPIVGTQYSDDAGRPWIYSANGTWQTDWAVVGAGGIADTDFLPEGAVNLYYTEARVTANTTVASNQSAIAAELVADAAQDALILLNTAKVSADLSIDTHSDVDTTTVAPVLGNTLSFDGTNFVPAAPSAATVATDDTIDGDGAALTPLTIVPSADVGNQLTLGLDGQLLVPAGAAATVVTGNGVQGDGSAGTPVAIQLSSDADNVVALGTDNNVFVDGAPIAANTAAVAAELIADAAQDVLIAANASDLAVEIAITDAEQTAQDALVLANTTAVAAELIADAAQDVLISANAAAVAAELVEDAAQDVLISANTAKVSADGSVDTHSDVDVSTVAPVLDDYLVFDGTSFVPAQLPTAPPAISDWAPSTAYAAGDEFITTSPTTLVPILYQVPFGFVPPSALSFDAVEESRYTTIGAAPGDALNQITQLSAGAALTFSAALTVEDQVHVVENVDALLPSDLNAIAGGSLYLDGVVDGDGVVPLNALSAFTYYRDGTDIYLLSAATVGGDIFTQMSQWDNVDGSLPVVEALYGDIPVARLEDNVPSFGGYELVGRVPTTHEQHVRIKVRPDDAQDSVMVFRIADAAAGLVSHTADVIIDHDLGAGEGLVTLDDSFGASINSPTIVSQVWSDGTLELVLKYEANPLHTSWVIYPAIAPGGTTDFLGFDGPTTGTFDIVELDLNYSVGAVGGTCAYDDCVEVDASAAAFTNVLPISSGSGYTRLFDLVDLTNGATFDRDAGGDTVNLSTGTGPWLTADNTAGSTAHKGQQILCTDVETTAGNDAWDCEALTGDPITTVSMNLQRLGSLAAPTAGLDAINRDYFEANDSVTTRYIDSSLAATDELLINALGSNPARLYTLADKTNAATLSVLPGQSLNGVVDATFNFHAYDVGTQFLVTDRAVGLWDVSVIGAGPGEPLLRGQISQPASVTVTANNSLASSVTGNIVNTWTVAEDGIYKVSYNGRARIAIASTNVSASVYMALVHTPIATGVAALVPKTTTENQQYIQSGVGNKQFSTFLTASAEIDLKAGDIITVRAGKSSGSNASIDSAAHQASYLRYEEVQTSTVVPAGMITPETLAYGRMTLNGSTGDSNDMGTVAAPVTAVYETADFSDDITVNPATGEFTIVKAGKYRPKAFHSAENRNDDIFGLLYVDGVEVERILWQIPGTTATGAVFAFAKREFRVGEVVTFRLAGPTTDDVGDQNRDAIVEYFELEQVSDLTVVMPDALELTDAHRFTLIKTAGQATTVTTYPAQERLTWQASPVDVGGGAGVDQYIVQAGGEGTWKFRVSAETEQAGTLDGHSTIQITVNGNEVSRSGFTTSGDNFGGGSSNDINYGKTDVEVENLVAGDVIEAHVSMAQGIGIVGTSTTTYFQGRQVSTEAVINTTDIAVNDQAASGYMDIGTMRIQWGTLVQASDVQVVTLPASFSDGNYSLVGSADGGNRFGNVAFSAKTTTTFVIANEAAAVAGAISWQAIGLKP